MAEKKTHPVAFITGASRGIGRALAEQLALEGFSLGLVARDADQLAEVCNLCKDLSPFTDTRFISTVCDVGNRNSVFHAASVLQQSLGSPDWVILNAGVAVPGHFADLKEEDFENAMRVNFFGSLYWVQACLESMAGGARLIFVNSGAGISGLFGYASYGASKFAQRGLAETLRMELKPRGIGVTLAFPPDTDTDQLRNEAALKPAETKLLTGQTRVWKPVDVAAGIIRAARKGRFLYLPGITLKLFYGLHADGGWFLRWYMDRLVKKARRQASQSQPPQP